MADDTYTGSPVAALAAALGTRLGSGGIGVVAARAGVGKTALLVHVALDTLLRGQQVLHVALKDTVDHARAHYDEVIRAVGDRSRVADAALKVERGRMIHSFHGKAFELATVERSLAVLREAAQFEPALLVIDGFDDPDALSAALPGLRRLATERGCGVWLTVRAEEVVPAELLSSVDVAIRLAPDGRTVRLRVIRGPDGAHDLSLVLDPTSLLVVGEDAVRARPEQRVSARECTLYSGGASGAETAFGEAADRWGVHEVNFTFDGHLQSRTRGRYELSPRELAMGDVSLAYVSKRLNRTYNDRGGLIRGVLQTLWHMVSRSQQVFVVGAIQDDGTVVGGTGWGVELARMWNRDLWVYDQEKVGWYRWSGQGWTAGTPEITALHVCGTGTRYLNDDGRAAIEDLFSRSFRGA